MSRPKIKESVRRRVIQRDGLYCRYCGFGPMRISWRVDPRSRVLLTCDTIDGDLGTLLNLDHKRCVVAGGESTTDNLVVSCARCNQQKMTGRPRKLLPAAPISLLPEPDRAAVLDDRRCFGGRY